MSAAKVDSVSAKRLAVGQRIYVEPPRDASYGVDVFPVRASELRSAKRQRETATAVVTGKRTVTVERYGNRWTEVAIFTDAGRTQVLPQSMIALAPEQQP